VQGRSLCRWTRSPAQFCRLAQQVVSAHLRVRDGDLVEVVLPGVFEIKAGFQGVIAEHLGDVVGKVVHHAAGTGRVGPAVQEIEVRQADGRNFVGNRFGGSGVKIGIGDAVLRAVVESAGPINVDVDVVGCGGDDQFVHQTRRHRPVIMQNAYLIRAGEDPRVPVEVAVVRRVIGVVVVQNREPDAMSVVRNEVDDDGVFSLRLLLCCGVYPVVRGASGVRVRKGAKKREAVSAEIGRRNHVICVRLAVSGADDLVCAPTRSTAARCMRALYRTSGALPQTS